jgi:hypothetical protein
MNDIEFLLEDELLLQLMKMIENDKKHIILFIMVILFYNDFLGYVYVSYNL